MKIVDINKKFPKLHTSSVLASSEMKEILGGDEPWCNHACESGCIESCKKSKKTSSSLEENTTQ